MRFGKRIINSVFMMLIFISYHISLVSFTHSHTFDGITISHSHPFKSGNFKHKHSIAEISFINSFAASLQYEINDSNLDFKSFQCLLNIFSYKCVSDYLIQEYNFILLRAPPAYFS